MFKKILVPLDGSKLAEKILPQVEELVKFSGAEVHRVLSVSLHEIRW
jgi:nucleotide-binding universal stress UspA family protein